MSENDDLRQIASELRRFNDRYESVPWYKLKLGQPLGYGLVGLVLFVLAAQAGDAAKGFLLISGSIFFVAQSIAGSRLKK